MGPAELLQKYKRKGVLFDTNLLLLLAIGMYSTHRIGTFDRTQKYTIEDYGLILRIAKFFDRRVTTPNILTEVDNLARQLDTREYHAIHRVLFDLITTSFEVYLKSSEATQMAVYPAVGLTDCVTMGVSGDVLVITDDFELFGRLSGLGRDCININHIRGLM